MLGKNVEKMESLGIVGGHVKWCGHCRKTVWRVSKVKELPHASYTSLLIPERIGSRIWGICTLLFEAARFTIAKRKEQSACRRVISYTNAICACREMLCSLYIAWMDPENSRLCEISQSQEDRQLAVPLYEEPGVVTVIEAENRRACWGGGNGVLCSMEAEFQVCKMKTLQDNDSLHLIESKKA